MRKLVLIIWIAGLLSADMSSAAVFSERPEWKIDFGEGVVGHPVLLDQVESTKGILATLRSGKIALISPEGKKLLTMSLDLPCETPVVAGNLLGDGSFSIVGVDVRGSVYCFDEKGERRWKFPRAVKSGEFRLPVLADLDGDGKLEIFVTDSNGHLQVLDASGRLTLEVAATTYRVGVPAVGDVDGEGKPEIIFGTEAGEVYCLNAGGEVVWFTTLDGCFGRALPLIADADADGAFEVFFPTAFNNARPGLFALDARTGKSLWKAPSVLQSYRSTVVADVDGDGKNEILFGDKNSSLFCLDAGGKQRWATQLQGRGIFFAPAVAVLGGNGVGTIFAVVRGAGSDGKSLYALDANGQMLDAIALPGGGASSPALCRFAGQSEVRLLALSGGGQLLCYRPDQTPGGAAKILWPGIRNDIANSGFVKTTSSRVLETSPRASKPVGPTRRHPALAGTNELPLPGMDARADLLSVRVIDPDKNIRVTLLRQLPGTETNAAFFASAPGEYNVTMEWLQTGVPEVRDCAIRDSRIA